MARYPNGRIPRGLLVHLGGDHWLTPGTKVRWDRLVADVLKNEGVRLRITAGPNAYRDYAAQVEAKRKHGKNAAWPGTSSHGGVFKGRDSMAIDVANWGQIGKTKFYRYARKHGFEPNYFDWEPWHIIDWHPWSVPADGGGSTPVPIPEPEPIPEEEEEDDMYKPTVHARLAKDGKTQSEWMLGHPDFGKGLPVFDGTATDKNSRLSADKSVKTFRGFMVTVNRDIFTAWARTYAKGTGEITSSTDRDGYVQIQKELSRVSGELAQ